MEKIELPCRTVRPLMILGSTGVVGRKVLELVELHREHYPIFALCAYQSVEPFFRQILRYRPEHAVLVSTTAADRLARLVRAHHLKTKVWAGSKALEQLVADAEVRMVVAAMRGIVSLPTIVRALAAGKRVLVANKESLVVGGRWVMDALWQGRGELLPLDSEHAALHRLLPSALRTNLGKHSLTAEGIDRLFLMATGGQFLGKPWEALKEVTPEEATRHPQWVMGQKITVDSSTMMNKGLEFIEARWLFGARYDELEIVLHPQAHVHGMVRTVDGQLYLHAAPPDMLDPIAYGLAYPERSIDHHRNLNFNYNWEFLSPLCEDRPCLKLALAVARDLKSAMPIVLNAANDWAVEAFLQKRISFTEIYSLVANTLDRFQYTSPPTLTDAMALDADLRKRLGNLVNLEEQKLSD